MNGILLVDKPAGITSHTVVAKLRRKLQTKKIGHAGTLDPTATGLLVLCIGNATKISGFVMDLDKSYQAKFTLGKVTTTYDTEGEITSEKDASHITEKNIRDALPAFCGEIAQKPPIFSAIKIKGKKLYEYARANQEVELPTRKVTIHSIDLLSFKAPLGVIEVACTKGTYIRSLVHDLGQALGVGACVDLIHRTKSAPFDIKNAISLDALLEMDVIDIQKRMIPISDILSKQLKTIPVSEEDEISIRHGVQFSKTNFSHENLTPDDLVLFISSNTQREIAIGRWGNSNRIEIKRVF